MADLPVDGAAIFARCKAILLKPVEEWPRIVAEAIPARAVFMGYVMPLAAIGPLCRFLRGQIFGWGAFGFYYHPGLVAGIAEMLVSYILSLVGIFVLALIADFLAPKFGGQAGRDNATRLIGYGATASFLAGVFSLLPGLSILGIAGLYSFYLFYTGAGPLMQVPQDKAVVYTVVTVLCAVALMVMVSAVTVPVMGLFSGGAVVSGFDGGGRITLPGGG